MLRLIASALVLASASASCGSSKGGPTDNPVTTMYPGQYNWTVNMVNFSCVYNIEDFKGSSDDERFAAAAKEASSNPDGGVVFFPKGSYKFTANLQLPSNVVIRGEPTTSPARSGTKPGSLKPATTFTCEPLAHNGILNTDPKATNLGIVNVELDGCAVMLWPGLTGASGSFNIKNYWYEAKEVAGAGSNKLVLGNVVHDVSYGYPDPSKSSSGQNQWPWRFSTAIAAYASSNILVANNLIQQGSTRKQVTVSFEKDNKPQTFKDVDYPVDNRYGIDVNRVLYGGVIGGLYSTGKCKQTSAGDGLTPSCAPFFFAQGVVVRDNYVFQNGRIGISWSGGGNGKTAGSGAQITGNHVEVAKDTTLYSVDGVHEAGGSDTNENRGFDQGGYGANVTGNTAAVNRQKTPGGYMSVDGEGVLHQASSNSDGLREVWMNNDLTYGTTGYMAYYKLSAPSYNVAEENKILSDEFIGCLAGNGGNCGKDNVCKGNSQSCKGW